MLSVQGASKLNEFPPKPRLRPACVICSLVHHFSFNTDRLPPEHTGYV